VLFLYDRYDAATRYRCDHQAEQLELLGLTSDTATPAEDLGAVVDRYDSFVLYRVAWRDELAAFIDEVRQRGKPLVFDTDDLVFEASLVRYLAFLDKWPEPERRAQSERFQGYRRTLEACDGATVSTEPLAEHARRHVGQVNVAFNVVSREMIRRAEWVRRLRSAANQRDAVVLAYLSGTRTHDRDFLEAAEGVLWALESYPHVRFVAVGKLTLDERFDSWGSRVVRVPLQPWRKLPKVLSKIDVNLAPLEPDNPITACKSCAKYLEAGLLGVPTIASPRPDFARVIDHGRNGLLAEGFAEWQDALRRVIESPDERRALGADAHADVRANHTTSVRPASLAAALGFSARIDAPERGSA
jgi:glycosyltransferase involved in cell wall biosynthesis